MNIAVRVVLEISFCSKYDISVTSYRITLYADVIDHALAIDVLHDHDFHAKHPIDSDE